MISYKQVNQKEFIDNLGTRTNDKKTIIFCISDGEISKTHYQLFNYTGIINSATILIGMPTSFAGTEIDIHKIHDNVDTIINKDKIILAVNQTLVNVILDEEQLSVSDGDIFYIEITKAADIRAGLITVQIEINL